MINIKKTFNKKIIQKKFFPTKFKNGIRLHEPTYNYEEITEVNKILLSSNLTFGKKTKQFENNFSKYIKTKDSVYVNSGSSANLLALSVLTNPFFKNHLKPGDEVIVPALSWSTSVWPIIQCNLVPVFVDVDPITLNIDPKKIKEAITKKTKCILIIHTYGNSCSMDEIVKIKEDNKLYLIEDTCESLGAKYKNKFCGTYGDIGTYSFYFSHHITTGEGGMMVSNNKEIIKISKMLRAHGWVRDLDPKDKKYYQNKYKHIDKKFLFTNIGYNIRGSEIGSAMGLIQLKKLNKILSIRRSVSKFWINYFKNSKLFNMQIQTNKSLHSWFGIPIMLKTGKIKLNSIRKFLDSKNIETRPIICGNITRQPAMKKFKYKIKGDLKNTDSVMKNSFAIGNHQNISRKNLLYAKNFFDMLENKYG